MKNILRISILIIFVIVAIILLFPSEYEDNIKAVSYDKEVNLIVNRTKVKSLDTIYSKGLELLGIKGERFVIREMSVDTKAGFQDKLTLIGSVTKYNDYYLIYTKLDSNKKMIDIASHELIHIQQYMDGRLEITDKNVRWENQLFSLPLTIKYENAPWEIDAFDKATEFKNLMYESLLVKK